MKSMQTYIDPRFEIITIGIEDNYEMHFMYDDEGNEE